MGELPIFTSNAHVFTIDPVTKKSWISSSKSIVQVNFFFDSSRNTYRIISVEGSKTIINSTVAPNMIFTKTSAKFGQWADLRAGIVYGVGFSSESYLSKFSEQFDIIRDKAKNIAIQTNGKESNLSDDKSGIFSSQSRKTEDDSVCENGPTSSIASVDDPCFLADAVKKLSLQNEALKQSFQQNSSELIKHKTELDGLKATNKNLTFTLQESMGKASDMHQKLVVLKEENETLKKKNQDLENEKVSMNKSLEELKAKNETLHKQHKEITQECSLLQQRIGILTVIEKQHDECAARIKSFMEENQQLQEEKQILDGRIAKSSDKRRADIVEVRRCCAEIASHLSFITEATKKLQQNTM